MQFLWAYLVTQTFYDTHRIEITKQLFLEKCKFDLKGSACSECTIGFACSFKIQKYLNNKLKFRPIPTKPDKLKWMGPKAYWFLTSRMMYIYTWLSTKILVLYDRLINLFWSSEGRQFRSLRWMNVMKTWCQTTIKVDW